MSSAFESISGSVYGVRSMPSSIASSPHSAPALPSPPTSPHLHGVSPPGSPSSLGSFPSALSAMGSIWSLDEVNMGRREDEQVAFSSQEHPESAHHLVIPSLALGPSLMPTPPPPDTDAAYGEALGNVRILVLGGQRSLADNLLMRSTQVVHIHGWDHPSGDVTACLEASTILADRERNVRLTVIPSYDSRDNEATKRAVSQVLQTLHASFQTLHQQLHPARAPGPDFTAMLASHRTPLVTAVVLVVSDPITAKEHDIISSIASHAPVITLPLLNRRRLPHSTTRPQTRSNSQTGLDTHHLAPPSLNRNATQRPHGHDRGRTTLRRSHAHASPQFAATSPPFAPYYSASPPFAPVTASPPFPPPREYVLHLNSISELAYVLFHNPRALAGLRDAAAARFIAWREREHDPSRSPQTQVATQESRPAAGLFGFEDPEAGSDLEPFQSSSDREDEDDMMIMRTLWKLSAHEPSTGAGATLRPGTTREPLPSFGTSPSQGEASPSPPRHLSSQNKVSPRSIHATSPNPGSASAYPPTRRSTKSKAAALERSVYHDPLHVPSLVALAVSVLPQMIGRVFGLTRSRNHKSKRGHIQSGGENDDGEGSGWNGLGILLRVGAACAATFCAGWVCGFWMA